jgi:hypothetical protein
MRESDLSQAEIRAELAKGIGDGPVAEKAREIVEQLHNGERTETLVFLARLAVNIYQEHGGHDVLGDVDFAEPNGVLLASGMALGFIMAFHLCGVGVDDQEPITRKGHEIGVAMLLSVLRKLAHKDKA